VPKYLLTDDAQSTALWHMKETNPAYSENLTTKARVARSPACTYFYFHPGALVTTAEDFPFIAAPKYGWRTPGYVDGLFEAGAWTFRVRLENDTRYPFTVRAAVRLSQSSNADGALGVRIGVYESPNTLSLPASAGGSVSDAWSVNLASLRFKYWLFAEYRIHIVTAATNTTARCSFACDEDPAVADESITTPAFTPFSEKILVQSFPKPYSRLTPITQQELKNKVSGAAILKNVNEFPPTLNKLRWTPSFVFFLEGNDLRDCWY